MASQRHDEASRIVLRWLEDVLEGSHLAPLRAGVQAMAEAGSTMDMTTLPFALGSSDAAVRLRGIKRVAEMAIEAVQSGTSAMQDEGAENSESELAHSDAGTSFLRSAVAASQFDDDAEVACAALDIETKLIQSHFGFAAGMTSSDQVGFVGDVLQEGSPLSAVARYSKVEQVWSSVATSRASSAEEIANANQVVSACLKACAAAVCRKGTSRGAMEQAVAVIFRHCPMHGESVSAVDAVAVRQLAAVGKVYAPLEHITAIFGPSPSEFPEVSTCNPHAYLQMP